VRAIRQPGRAYRVWASVLIPTAAQDTNGTALGAHGIMLASFPVAPPVVETAAIRAAGHATISTSVTAAFAQAIAWAASVSDGTSMQSNLSVALVVQHDVHASAGGTSLLADDVVQLSSPVTLIRPAQLQTAIQARPALDAALLVARSTCAFVAMRLQAHDVAPSTSVATRLLVSDLLPPAMFSITLSAPPTEEEAVDVTCAVDGSGTAAGISVAPPYTVTVTRERHLASRGAVSFSVTPVYPLPLAAVSTATSLRSAVACTVTSRGIGVQTGAATPTGATAADFTYPGTTPLAAEIVIVPTVWPLFTDVVVESALGTLRSVWGSEIVRLPPPGVDVGMRRMQAASNHSMPALWRLTPEAAQSLLRVATRPPPVDSLFVLPMSGATNITLVAGGSFRGAHARFLPGTTVLVAGVPSLVRWISPDGRWLRLTTPPLAAVCPDSATSVNARCPTARITVVPPPTWNATVRAALVGALGDTAAAEADAAVMAGTAVPSAPLSCPPFCPGRGGSALIVVSFAPRTPVPDEGMARWVADTGITRMAAVEEGFVQIAPAGRVASGTAAGTGIAYTTVCVGDYVDPTSGVCGNASHPMRRMCAAGSGDTCRPCPEGTVCITPTAVLPLPGWYTTTTDGSVDPVPCPTPATERCVGWDGAVTCGAEYLQGSPGCGSCGAGFYAPAGQPGCVRCPDVSSPLAVAIPILIFIACLLAAAVGLMALLMVVAVARGGSKRRAVKGAVKVVIAAVSALQLFVTLGRAAAPGLPSGLQSVYVSLAVLQFENIALPPACLSGPVGPFLAQAVQSAIALTFMAVIVAVWQLDNVRSCCCACPPPPHKRRSVVAPAPSTPGSASGASALARVGFGHFHSESLGELASAATGSGGGTKAEVRSACRPTLTQHASPAHVIGSPQVPEPIPMGAPRPHLATPLETTATPVHPAAGVGDTAGRTSGPSRPASLYAIDLADLDGPAATAALAFCPPPAPPMGLSPPPDAFSLPQSIKASGAPPVPSPPPRADHAWPAWRVMGLRVVSVLACVLYATVCNTSFATVSCVTQRVTVATYASMDADGRALASAGITFPLELIRRCIDFPLQADCGAVNGVLTQEVTPAVQRSNPFVVCYERAHVLGASLAWITIVFYVVALPVVLVTLLAGAMREALQPGSMLKARYDTSALTWAGVTRAWIGDGQSACSRGWRTCMVACVGPRAVPVGAALAVLRAPEQHALNDGSKLSQAATAWSPGGDGSVDGMMPTPLDVTRVTTARTARAWPPSTMLESGRESWVYETARHGSASGIMLRVSSVLPHLHSHAAVEIGSMRHPAFPQPAAASARREPSGAPNRRRSALASARGNPAGTPPRPMESHRGDVAAPANDAAETSTIGRSPVPPMWAAVTARSARGHFPPGNVDVITGDSRRGLGPLPLLMSGRSRQHSFRPAASPVMHQAGVTDPSRRSPHQFGVGIAGAEETPLPGAAQPAASMMLADTAAGSRRSSLQGAWPMQSLSSIDPSSSRRASLPTPPRGRHAGGRLPPLLTGSASTPSTASHDDEGVVAPSATGLQPPLLTKGAVVPADSTSPVPPVDVTDVPAVRSHLPSLKLSSLSPLPVPLTSARARASDDGTGVVLPASSACAPQREAAVIGANLRPTPILPAAGSHVSVDSPAHAFTGIAPTPAHGVVTVEHADDAVVGTPLPQTTHHSVPASGHQPAIHGTPQSGSRILSAVDVTETPRRATTSSAPDSSAPLPSQPRATTTATRAGSVVADAPPRPAAICNRSAVLAAVPPPERVLDYAVELSRQPSMIHFTKSNVRFSRAWWVPLHIVALGAVSALSAGLGSPTSLRDAAGQAGGIVVVVASQLAILAAAQPFKREEKWFAVADAWALGLAIVQVVLGALQALIARPSDGAGDRGGDGGLQQHTPTVFIALAYVTLAGSMTLFALVAWAAVVALKMDTRPLQVHAEATDTNGSPHRAGGRMPGAEGPRRNGSTVAAAFAHVAAVVEMGDDSGRGGGAEMEGRARHGSVNAGGSDNADPLAVRRRRSSALNFIRGWM